TPILTLLNTSRARTRAVHIRETQYDETYNPLEKSDPGQTRWYAIPEASIGMSVDSVHQVVIEGRSFFLPLGWRLSKRTIDQIDTDWPNTSLTRKLIMLELTGEDTDEVKGRKKK